MSNPTAEQLATLKEAIMRGLLYARLAKGHAEDVELLHAARKIVTELEKEVTP